ncbi:hypothetical protein NF681_04160 [Comamonadaceae bacterium OTU4NAUVB1]|nr:hypothetical protein NF681_04160 [Comamonadaceae bacterium OTU4NAUVB1]
MEKIILYVDDAAYAREFLARATADQVGGDGARHWMLVACAPRMTHRISKWVSHSARENWRGKWFAKTQEQVVPLLSRPGDAVTPLLAQGPLADLTLRLKREHGAGVRVVDARRPKIGVDLEPVAAIAPAAPADGKPGWSFPGVAMGLGALLVLANGFAE